MGTEKKHKKFLDQLHQKAQSTLLKKHENDTFQPPPDLNQPGAAKKELFKKRQERNMEEESAKFDKEIEAIQNVPQKQQHRANPEEPFGFTKEKLKEGEFNPILSS